VKTNKKTISPKPIAVAASLAAMQIGAVYAQNASNTLNLEEVVVTGTASRVSKMKQSVSLSTLSTETIEMSGATNSAEVLRSVPGMRSESTGGEGNANINVRGLPSPDGGARYAQYQENGLPIMLFGDIMFGTADGYHRVDNNLDRLEVLRGGSAATFTSNAPGAILNFIDKTGEEKGGSIGITKGVNFDRTRYDMSYGGPISDYTRFFIGGYMRQGEGVRTSGNNAENGGQVKANITHDLGKGDYVRLNFKSLDDQVPTFLPVPIQKSGAYAGFDPLTGFTMPKGLIDTATNANGQKVVTDTSNGIRTKSTSFGGELNLSLENGWKLNDKFRTTSNSGSWVGMFGTNVHGTVSDLISSANLGAQTTAQKAAKINPTLATNYGATSAVFNKTGASAMNSQAYVGHLFNVSIKDMGNTVNDLKATKSFTLDSGAKLDSTIGLFNMTQNIVSDWQWSSYMMSIDGANPQVIDVLNSSGSSINSSGSGFMNGAAAWGNCCVRSYNLKYNQTAPYAALAWEKDKINADVSLRIDTMRANGNAIGQTVNYDLTRPAYTSGINYRINPDLSTFARFSHGTRFNADRVADGSGINKITGGIANADSLFDTVDQYEVGAKMREGNLSLFSTLFKAKTRITSYDPTATPSVLAANYDSQGVEVEAGYRAGSFRIAAGVTYTDAKIVETSMIPQRQAKLVYQLTPTYTAGDWIFGGSLISTSHSYADNANTVDLPGYKMTNAFVGYSIDKKTTANLSINNLFNKVGLTEAQGYSGNNYSARPTSGRAIQAGLKYNF
jgi:outer membrane receptor protein involved in Fe transport